MEKSAPTNGKTSSQVPTTDARSQEKIIFEIQPLVLPTILNLENLTIVGFSFIIVLVAVIFHLGLSELLIIGLLYAILAFPSLRQIFMAGSTTYVLTNQRLVFFTVRLGSKEQSIPLTQIQDVKTRSSGLQRFYGAGDIIITQKQLRGTVRMRGLNEIKRRAEQIRQAVQKAQNK